MLKPQPLANAFAATAVIFILFLYFLKIIAPPIFKLLINSQFLGADIASQVPPANIANALGILIAVAVISWVLGYLVGIFYNKFNQ
ncbi:hypothetical protein A3F02_02020 [Candidatus Curtissbacteria bacterium RIFCSPHIGHO2_12_FULL_38_9b]|uniref:DUF2062 domain-containing protein n=2 Tax=Candidatus Curtissiibacteriota TaxID=1752717 RepID=A0A1F5GXP4_9BACT|nr:MAG: hypothetical protein A3A48_00390 [Candidatus Curtissbacteria bacterium RIFCSPLOWO2_01_FULL_37_9]OGD96656.1 MAG: hypothetical protein A3F02_02020 [Candidatus Curtissbacteria bacterium RIFCSPHIGHO2_12_FULL_38_9b]